MAQEINQRVDDSMKSEEMIAKEVEIKALLSVVF